MIANILIAVGFFTLGFLLGGAFALINSDKKVNEKKDEKQIVICIDGIIYADED